MDVFCYYVIISIPLLHGIWNMEYPDLIGIDSMDHVFNPRNSQNSIVLVFL